MKLPKLPPLNRDKRGGQTRASSLTSAMAAISPGSVPPKSMKEIRALVKKHGYRLIKDAWGDVGDGRWTCVIDLRDRTRTVIGTCWTCGELRRAIDLKPQRLKDGTDAWKCTDCS